ncbi:hypothetical protein ACFLRM_03180 [Acidobacteriota bacterium]
MAYSDGGNSFTWEIYYCTYKNGQWKTKERISYSAYNSQWCSIDVDGNDVYIVWYQDFLNKRPQIHLKVKKIGGEWPTNPGVACTDEEDGFMYPCLKVKGGHIYLIYQVQDYVGDAVKDKYLEFKEKISGGSWSSGVYVGRKHWENIEVDDYGCVHCIYASKVPKEARYRYRDRENEWLPQRKINTADAEPGFFKLDYAQNTLVAVYMGRSSWNDNRWVVYFRVRRFDRGWQAWEPNSIEVDLGGVTDLPQVAIDPDGFAHIVWTDWNSTSDTSPDTIWYNKWKVAEPVAPLLDLNKYSLFFEAQQDTVAATQAFKIRNSSSGTLNFSVTADKDWITFTPTGGNSSGSWKKIAVDVDTRIEEGTHTGAIEVSSPEAANSPLILEVALAILPPPIYEPLNGLIQVIENRSLFFLERIHFLTFEENPLNKNITSYIITCEYIIDGISDMNNYEVSSDTFQLINRMMPAYMQFAYIIRAVDEKGRVGPPCRVYLEN